jgi:hypothetical protein
VGGPTSTPYGGPRGPAPPPTGPRGTSGAVTARRRAQEGDAGSGLYRSLHPRRHWETLPLRQWCEGGSERVGVCSPAFAPSLKWLPCILPKHTWLPMHMCALFQSESCDITRTHTSTNMRAMMHGVTLVSTCHWYVRTRTYVRTYLDTMVLVTMVPVLPWYVSWRMEGLRFKNTRMT